MIIICFNLYSLRLQFAIGLPQPGITSWPCPDYFETIFRLDTEIWDFESTKTEIINPTLTSGHYAYGMGLFTVEAGFCNKPKTTTTNVYTTTNGYKKNVYTNCIILFSMMLITGFLWQP